MNRATRERKSLSFKRLSIAIFLFLFLSCHWIFAYFSAYSSNINISSQEQTQEQKPPEEKKEEEKKTEQEIESIIKKEEEILTGKAVKMERDPFKSLIEEAAEKRSKQVKLRGVAGMSIEELTVIGIVEMEEEFLALVNGPDNVGYILRLNDEVLNGKVIEIDLKKIVFEQEIKDHPLIKSRKITKRIHPEKGG